jgi:predicted Zn-dependent peptidase
VQTTTFQQVNETLYSEQLPNGLKVYLLPKMGFGKTYAVFTTRYGSIDSHFRISGGAEVHVPDGIAHFLEHKMFDKQDRDVFQDFSRNGASCNAFTTFNRTAYLFSCTDLVEENLNILLDFVQEPYFTEQSVEKEKGIIGQEIRMYDDNPDWKVYTSLLKAMYREHPVRIEIAGTVESIAKITKDTLYQCYETFYHPSNMILFVVGSFDPEAIMQAVRKNQAGKSFSSPAPKIERFFPQEPAALAQKQVENHLAVGLPKCMIGFKDAHVGLSGEALLRREMTTKLLLDILFGTSSALYQKLYEAGLITESFDYDYTCEQDYAYSLVGGDTPDPERLKEMIQQEISHYLQTGIAQDEFERSKRKKIGHFLRSLNSIEYIANQFTSYTFNGTDLFAVLPVLESITLQEVTERMGEHLRFDQMAVSIVRSAANRE